MAKATLKAKTGFTIMEIIVALALGAVIVTAVYKLLIGQSRLYMKQNELMDVRTTLRSAASLLAWELRQTSPSGGDLYEINTYWVTLRSVQGSGIVCAKHTTLPRFAVWGVRGEFNTAPQDSALLFAAGAKGTQDDMWSVIDLEARWDPGSGGVPKCVWDDGMGGYVDPDLVVAVGGTTDGVIVGGSIRAFRRVEYSIYPEGDRWWLGRKVGNAADYERLIGPLRPPGDSGLAFVYYDRAGNPTADPAQVALVDIVLKAESLRRAPMTGDPFFQKDTLRVRVSTRN
jgi:prepilin-type N-terminal cleavage/methylation domain-containing protein